MKSDLSIREAKFEDIPALRTLLADDDLGRTREDLSEAGLVKYQHAFQAIDASPDNELFVAEQDGDLVGTFQLTWIPYLSRGGSLRCLIEAVRVASSRRGQGLGAEMMRFAIERAREKDCALVQLTTDRTRSKAHRFYQKLGFVWTHQGMKLALSSSPGQTER